VVEVDDPDGPEQVVVGRVDHQQAKQLAPAASAALLVKPALGVRFTVGLRDSGPARDLGVLTGGDDRRDVRVRVQA
jgi:hypothetical protein